MFWFFFQFLEMCVSYDEWGDENTITDIIYIVCFAVREYKRRGPNREKKSFLKKNHLIAIILYKKSKILWIWNYGDAGENVQSSL